MDCQKNTVIETWSWDGPEARGYHLRPLSPWRDSSHTKTSYNYVKIDEHK